MHIPHINSHIHDILIKQFAARSTAAHPYRVILLFRHAVKVAAIVPIDLIVPDLIALHKTHKLGGPVPILIIAGSLELLLGQIRIHTRRHPVIAGFVFHLYAAVSGDVQFAKNHKTL